MRSPCFLSLCCSSSISEFSRPCQHAATAAQEKGADDDLDVEKGAYTVYSALKQVDTGLRHCSAQRIPVPSRAIGSRRGRRLSMKGTRKSALSMTREEVADSCPRFLRQYRLHGKLEKLFAYKQLFPNLEACRLTPFCRPWRIRRSCFGPVDCLQGFMQAC